MGMIPQHFHAIPTSCAISLTYTSKQGRVTCGWGQATNKGSLTIYAQILRVKIFRNFDWK